MVGRLAAFFLAHTAWASRAATFVSLNSNCDTAWASHAATFVSLNGNCAVQCTCCQGYAQRTLNIFGVHRGRCLFPAQFSCPIKKKNLCMPCTDIVKHAMTRNDKLVERICCTRRMQQSSWRVCTSCTLE